MVVEELNLLVASHVVVVIVVLMLVPLADVLLVVGEVVHFSVSCNRWGRCGYYWN